MGWSRSAYVLVIAILVATAACYPPPPAPTTLPGTTGSFQGPNPGPTTRIEIGQHVEDIVQAFNQACYPQWDSSGRCREYSITPSATGTLTVSLGAISAGAISRNVEMDLFSYFGARPEPSERESDGRWRARVQVRAGIPVGFMVMAYAYPQAFVLDSEFAAGTASLEPFRVLHAPAVVLAIRGN